jgi:hypothetical protein
MTFPVRHKHLVAIAGVLATLCATEAFSQGRRMKYSRELSTVKELHIEIGPLDDQARRCGISAADLEAPARAALGTPRISVLPSTQDFLFVNALVVNEGETCAAAVNVELFRWSNQYGAQVSVWEHASLITGNPDGFNGRIREKVDQLTRDFIDDWTKSRR